jgi:hypothetical protein
MSDLSKNTSSDAIIFCTLCGAHGERASMWCRGDDDIAVCAKCQERLKREAACDIWAYEPDWN